MGYCNTLCLLIPQHRFHPTRTSTPFTREEFESISRPTGEICLYHLNFLRVVNSQMSQSSPRIPFWNMTISPATQVIQMRKTLLQFHYISAEQNSSSLYWWNVSINASHSFRFSCSTLLLFSFSWRSTVLRFPTLIITQFHSQRPINLSQA